jgi:hypothetical protein
VTAALALARVLPESQVDDAIQLLDEDQLATFELYARQIAEYAQAVTSKPLANTTEAHRLSALLERSATARKALESLRDDRVRPLNNEVRAVNALFATVRDQIDSFRKRAEGCLVLWRRQEQARQQREQEEAAQKLREAQEREARARQAEEQAATVEERKAAAAAADQALTEQIEVELDGPRMVPKALKTAGGGSTGFREVIVLRSVEDWSKVPPEFFVRPRVLDAVTLELRAAVRAGRHDIPGCDIGPEEKVVVRGA